MSFRQRFLKLAEENFFVPKLLNFMLFASWGCYFPFLSIFFRYVGYSQSEIGLLLSITPFIGSVSATFWTGLADRFHKHKLLLVGNMTVASVVLTTLSFAEHVPFGVTMAIMACFSFIRAPVNPLMDAAVLQMLGEHKQLYGRQRLFASISWGLCSFVSGIIVQRTSVHSIFYCFAFCAGAFVIIAAFTPLYRNTEAPVVSQSWKRIPAAASSRNLRMAADEIEDPDISEVIEEEQSTTAAPPKPVGRSEFFKSVRALVFNRAYMLLLFATYVFAGGMTVVVAFLFVYLQDEFGAESSLLGVSVVASILLELPLMFFGKTLLQKVGARRLIMVAFSVLSIRMVGYTFITAAWQAILIELMHGMTYSVLWIAGVDYANTVAPPNLKATSQGMFAASYSLGSGCGSILGGLVYQHFGAMALFRGEAVVCVVTLLVFAALSWFCSDDAVQKIDDDKAYARMGGDNDAEAESVIELTDVGAGSIEGRDLKSSGLEIESSPMSSTSFGDRSSNPRTSEGTV
eukprot:TRINITY_DN18272_c0_g1_i1.p1 TRINITY_DN18272_c0_g1~~TRINITY_DN18272_c0_g1_i1.p1  ORF type:complete len:516 (-),score=162.00 TRINITY_DN18272_c0_g1_i1:170-1717(-)